MNFFLVLALVTVIITGISQVLLKIGAGKEERNRLFFSSYLNLPTLTAYGLLFVVTVIAIIVLQGMPLKLFYAIASLNFVIVLVLSWSILKERINPAEICAVFIIVSGVLVFNL
jgi:small multidrug resistance pump